ncbi:MAG: hypothetical protein Q4F97_01350 [Bacteroidales bacterium]|nr:hypothetical protein [Bacteroidales bacterium]
MLKINIIPQNEQAIQFLSDNDNKTAKEPFIHAGAFKYISWALVNENIYFPTHRNGAFDMYVYLVGQFRFSGDSIDGMHHFKEGDMLIMQSGSTNAPSIRYIGPNFKAFEFWFTEDGLLKGVEKPDYMKFTSSQFPINIKNDVLIRHIFGEGAPVEHINDLKVKELILPPDTQISYTLNPSRMFGIYVIKGNGVISDNDYTDGDAIEITQTDKEHGNVLIDSKGDYSTHIMLFDMMV